MIRWPALLFAVSVSLSMTVPNVSGKPEVRLNEYGHIEFTTKRIQKQGQFTFGGAPSVENDRGSVAFIFSEEDHPTTIEFYDKAGNLRFSRVFKRIINLKISNDRHYAAFFDGSHLVVLNLEDGSFSNYPATITFALDRGGNPAYYHRKTRTVVYQDGSIEMTREPLDILFFNDMLVLFCPKEVFYLKNDRLEEIFHFEGKYFEAVEGDNCLYFVEKKTCGGEFHYSIHETQDGVRFSITDERIYRQPDNPDTHEPIGAPLHYYEPSFPSLVKNAYAQIQEWSHLYLHPGIDLFEAPYTQAYSVQNGIVRAILTTGDEQYWRIAIESFSTPGEGYLYAHLNQDSFPFAVGDSVNAGDVVGTLFPAYSFSPHLHFARISPDGVEWNGEWWTVDNPLVDITNMADTLAPVIEYALGNDRFAFRTREGVYLDPMNLSGEIQIIAKCCDYAHSIDFYSRIPVYDLEYRLYPAENPDSVIYEQFSFALDMPLDTYFSEDYQMLVLNTIYSRDATCFSTNNNSVRDFFFIITNSNGDSAITIEDSLEVFDTTQFPNGTYILEVEVRDASGNMTSAFMPIAFDNVTPVSPAPVSGMSPIMPTASPNPFNQITTITFALREKAQVDLSVYDVSGRLVANLMKGWKSRGPYKVRFDGSNLASGIYIYRLTAGDYSAIGKAVLLK